MRIQCLEHGFIELVSSMNGDFEIYRNAKVSTGTAKQDDVEDQKRLINFLVQNRHTSPLEFVELEFHMKAPIYVVRQHVRHRLQEMNEYSLRYRSIIPEYESVADLEDLTQEEKDEYNLLCKQQLDYYNNVVERMKAKYPNKEDFLKRARVREKIRGVMGTSFYTELYWKMNLHAFANWIEKRIGQGAQPEIRVFAEAALKLVEPICPIAIGAIKEHWLKDVLAIKEPEYKTIINSFTLSSNDSGEYLPMCGGVTSHALLGSGDLFNIFNFPSGIPSMTLTGINGPYGSGINDWKKFDEKGMYQDTPVEAGVEIDQRR